MVISPFLYKKILGRQGFYQFGVPVMLEKGMPKHALC
jgi:hypothetical protein